MVLPGTFWIIPTYIFSIQPGLHLRVVLEMLEASWNGGQWSHLMAGEVLGISLYENLWEFKVPPQATPPINKALLTGY